MVRYFVNQALDVDGKATTECLHRRSYARTVWTGGDMNNSKKSKLTTVHTHTRITALVRDYPGEPVPEK